MDLVNMKLKDGSTILIEGFPTTHREKISKSKKVIEKIDVFFDEVIKKHIVNNCEILLSAFEALKEKPIPPSRATAEFGLQINAEGDIYVVKASSQGTFKITIEWDLIE